MATTREKLLEIARSLPPTPRVFSELDRLLLDPHNALAPIAELIKRDTALAARLIRVSNSVAYRGEQRVGSVEEAVARIGFFETYRLAGQVAGAQLAERALKFYGIEADELRDHMLHTAFVCEHLALECGLDPRRAYTAGLMRPLGLLVLDRVAEGHPQIARYHPVRDRDFLAWEGRMFGLSSPEVAAMVLGEWSFPPETIDAVRSQYLQRPEDSACRLACLLNLAGGLVADAGQALLGEVRHWGANAAKLEAAGLDEARFRVAGARGRQAFADFQRRLRGDEAPAVTEGGAPHGAMAVDSCNFPVRARVVEANDEPPVHTPTSGLIPPADFTTFMRAYQDMVFSTAARLTRNDAQAEDISQEVFIKAHEHFNQLRTSPTAGGWLKTVATNLSLNHLSRYRNRWRFFSEFKRDDAGTDEPDVEFAAPDSFFSNVDASERREWIERALDQLPDHQRVPLVLYHFEDLPYEDIARQLGVSLAKVKTDILRARAALAKILQRSGTAHEKLTS